MYDVAIINYNSSNLFSVKSACNKVGLSNIITNESKIIKSSKSIILPGVGSFGSAIKKINQLDLNKIIHDFSSSGKPIFGICLGMQLLFEESLELGTTEGLCLLKGQVSKLKKNTVEPLDFRIPHIGWSPINKSMQNNNSLLESVKENAYMYFVHSYKVDVDDKNIITSTSTYGNNIINSSIEHKNLFATQFHPEKSGLEGLKVYQNFKKKIYE